MSLLSERLDADATFTGDLGDVLDAELALRLKLGGQAVRVPAEAALDAVALHGLVAAHHVLDVARYACITKPNNLLDNKTKYV